jgi:hypothetical protein
VLPTNLGTRTFESHCALRLPSACRLFAESIFLESSITSSFSTTDEQLPILKGSNPKPEDAEKAVLAAFYKYEVVGMSAAHGNKDLDDLILHIVRNPVFPTKVNDIAVECGNSLYQSVLDRYIAGEDVPLSEVRQVWRNTTQPMCSVSAFYEELVPLVRRINQKLLPEKRIRVPACDPPLDWSRVKDKSEVMLDRDASIASVMEKEVLSKHRKALMLFGAFHLFHFNNVPPVGLESAVQRYKTNYPGVTLVIADVFSNLTDLPKFDSDEMEARMASWPVPSLVQDIEGTWLVDVDKTYFSKTVDAYLYLGPSDLLLVEPRPAEIFSNGDFMAELRRRAAIMGNAPVTNQTNPDKLSDQNFSPFSLDPFVVRDKQ